MFDLIIIGGGPAGIGAGIYAARKKIKTLLITDTFGGQSVTSADVRNFVGIKSISGYDLANQLEEHLRAQEGVEIVDGDLVVKISPIPPINPIGLISPIPPISPILTGFYVSTEKGKTFETKTILLAMGSKRRKLGVPGEKEFDGKGVAYCGTCDAPLFKDKRVAVVGAGNAGIETAIDLLPYASEIFLIVRSERIKGDIATFEKINPVRKPELIDSRFLDSGAKSQSEFSNAASEISNGVKTNSKVKIYFNTEVREIFGGETVKGVVLRNSETGEASRLALDGIFEEIGWIPNSEIVKDLVKLGQYGEILIDHKTQKTSRVSIWAAGDITDVLYKQNNISIGDGIKAVLNIYDYLNKSN